MNELSVNTKQNSLDMDSIVINRNDFNNNNNNNNNINTISSSEQQQQQQHNINETGVDNELYWGKDGDDDDDDGDNTNRDYKRKTIRNSAQDAKFYTPPDSPTQEYDDDKYDKYSSFSDKSSSISQNSNNNSKDSLNSKEGNDGTTTFGGILVTTIQVVEVSKNQKNNEPLQQNDNNNGNNDKNIQKNTQNIKQQQVTFATNNNNDSKSIIVDNADDISFHEQQQLLQQKQSNNIKKRLSMQTMKDRRKSRIYNDIVISELIQDFDEAQKKYSEIKVVRTQSNKRTRQTKRTNNAVYRKITKSRPRLPLVKAPTSNPPHSNDPTDMDEDLPPIKHQSYPWVPEINTPPKLIHASLVPLSLHKERLSIVQQDENNVSNNNNNDNDKENEQITTTKVGSTRPLVTRIAKLKILNRNSSKRLSRANSKRKQKRVSAIIPRQQRASQIFRQNVLEQSVFLSFNGNVTTGNPQFYPSKNLNNTNDNDNDNINISHDKSNVVNNSSSGSKYNKRKSLRRQTVRKSIIGERELKKDRRRKEKKKINKTLSDDESGEIAALNPIIIQKILDSEVLEKRVKEDLLIKQRMMSPKPPPRRATTELHLSTEINQSSDTTTAAHTFKRHKTTNSLLIAPLPDRRSVRSELNNRSLYKSIDFPTFPAHLSRHSYYTEKPDLVIPPLPSPLPQ